MRFTNVTGQYILDAAAHIFFDFKAFKFLKDVRVFYRDRATPVMFLMLICCQAGLRPSHPQTKHN